MPPLLLILLSIFISTSSSLPAILPNPEPLQLPSPSTSTNPTTIPAFPEQSDVSSTTCHLNLPSDILPNILSSCSTPSRSHCCPALSAWLYAGFASSSLSPHNIVPSNYELPALPDDSEACIGGVERALRERGAELPRVNATCDVAYCYCGVRLRRLTCNGAFVSDGRSGRLRPGGDGGRRLARECAKRGSGGCSRCLRLLNQLKTKEKKQHNNVTVSNWECQLLGITWLLSKNHTLYLPAATSILRAFMEADATGTSDPASCSHLVDDLPLAVGSDQLNSNDGTSLSGSFAPFWFSLVLLSLAPLVLSLLHDLY